MEEEEGDMTQQPKGWDSIKRVEDIYLSVNDMNTDNSLWQKFRQKFVTLNYTNITFSQFRFRKKIFSFFFFSFAFLQYIY